jgi:RNA polymerase sigma-70 factor, ECF subfamily
LEAAIEQLGARAELERLFMAHHVRVLKAAYRITGNLQDAEDVVQTVFLRVAQGGAGPMQNPGSYLYRAGINAALDLVRKRQVVNATSLDDAVSPEDAPPDGDLAMREMRACLRQAMARLGPRAAEMFVLRYLEGLDNREIARLLNTSPAVVAVILYRTRARLRNDLRDQLRGKP